MTAPEVTPAVRRAAEALATDQEHIPWAGHRHPDNWEGHARAALSAGVDVEQIEQTLRVAVLAWADRAIQPGETLLRFFAQQVRTAILGPDVVWQGDGVRAVASNLVAVDEEGDE